jgi:outer membrane translocation and assembly module TamA
MPLVDRDGTYRVRNDWLNIGGESYSEAHLELRYRFLPNFQLTPFLDAGTVGLDPGDILSDYRLSAGVGLSIHRPIMIRFDLGYPIIERDHDDRQAFHFSVGYQF